MSWTRKGWLAVRSRTVSTSSFGELAAREQRARLVRGQRGQVDGRDEALQEGRGGEVGDLVDAGEALGRGQHRAHVRALLEDRGAGGPARRCRCGPRPGTPPPRPRAGAAASRCAPCGAPASSACPPPPGPRGPRRRCRWRGGSVSASSTLPSRPSARPRASRAALQVPVERHEGRLRALLHAVLELLQEARLAQAARARDPDRVALALQDVAQHRPRGRRSCRRGPSSRR